jgi:ribosomal protein S18 acetylase RimI-like enzyme
MGNDYVLRTILCSEDAEAVRRLVSSTGFFSHKEIKIAGELVDETLSQGEQTGYSFIFAEHEGLLDGYCCFGPIPLTRTSFDLYWIAVMPGRQGCGLGRRLMEAAEESIRNRGGTRVYADTSSRGQYLSTRVFYEAIGYCGHAYLPDFYAPGDGKIVYCKELV